MVETKKENKLLKNVPTDSIIEFNDLIYAREKLDSEKIDIPLGTQTKIQKTDGKFG